MIYVEKSTTCLLIIIFEHTIITLFNFESSTFYLFRSLVFHSFYFVRFYDFNDVASLIYILDYFVIRFT